MTALRVLLIKAVYNSAMEIRIDDPNKVTASFFRLSAFTVFTSCRKLDSRHDILIMLETTLVNSYAKATEADRVPLAMEQNLRSYSGFVKFGPELPRYR